MTTTTRFPVRSSRVDEQELVSRDLPLTPKLAASRRGGSSLGRAHPGLLARARRDLAATALDWRRFRI